MQKCGGKFCKSCSSTFPICPQGNKICISMCQILKQIWCSACSTSGYLVISIDNWDISMQKREGCFKYYLQYQWNRIAMAMVDSDRKKSHTLLHLVRYWPFHIFQMCVKSWLLRGIAFSFSTFPTTAPNIENSNPDCATISFYMVSCV